MFRSRSACTPIPLPACSRRGCRESVHPNPSELKQLLARLEHDVRNPIGNVIGYIDLLREGDSMNSEQLDLLQRIERNCEMVLQVVERFSETIENLAIPE